MDETARALLTRCDIGAMAEAQIRHPWNANSDVYLKRLSQAAGLKRLALAIARVPPGRESFLYHRHECSEEFLFILSGRGRAEIGEDSFEVCAGDFLGFPAPNGPPHHLANPFGQDLVYLMGGESGAPDIGYFPRLGRRLIFTAGSIWGVADEACAPLTAADWSAGPPSGGLEA